MPIKVIAVGRLKEKYWLDAGQEYLKRINRYDKITLDEVADQPEPANAGERALELIALKEGETVLSHIRKEDRVIALCIDGESLGSEAFAQNLLSVKNAGRRHVFVIGASNGIGSNVLARADERLSFSPMTFPHQMARVMLLEQIYRACKINAGERYHK